MSTIHVAVMIGEDVHITWPQCLDVL